MDLDEWIDTVGIEVVRESIFSSMHTARSRLWASHPRIATEPCSGRITLRWGTVCTAAAELTAIDVIDVVESIDQSAPFRPLEEPIDFDAVRRARRPIRRIIADPPTSREPPTPPPKEPPSIPVEQIATTSSPLDLTQLIAETLPGLVRTLIDKGFGGSLPAIRALIQLAPVPKYPLIKGAFADPDQPFTGDPETCSLRVLWLVNQGAIDVGLAKELLDLLRNRHDMLKPDIMEMRLQMLEDEQDEPSRSPLDFYPFVPDPSAS